MRKKLRPLYFTGSSLQEAMRIMSCMGPEEFVDLFGETSGTHYWNKYAEEFNVAKLIMGMDLSAIDRISDYIKARIHSMEEREREADYRKINELEISLKGRK